MFGENLYGQLAQMGRGPVLAPVPLAAATALLGPERDKRGQARITQIKQKAEPFDIAKRFAPEAAKDLQDRLRRQNVETPEGDGAEEEGRPARPAHRITRPSLLSFDAVWLSALLPAFGVLALGAGAAARLDALDTRIGLGVVAALAGGMRWRAIQRHGGMRPSLRILP
ncbi:MAG: hypothetical protein AAF281_13320 [Pseudomonadota bacterium]